MERGISLVTDNEILVDKVRCQVEQDFNKEIDPSPESPHKIYRQLIADSIETPVYTFTLPDITRYPGKKSLQSRFVFDRKCGPIPDSRDPNISLFTFYLSNLN